MDEVALNIFNRLLNEIERTLDNCRLIFSSRPSQYLLIGANDFCVFKKPVRKFTVEALSFEQQLYFINTQFGFVPNNSAKLKEELINMLEEKEKTTEGYNTLSRNPFMRLIIVAV